MPQHASLLTSRDPFTSASCPLPRSSDVSRAGLLNHLHLGDTCCKFCCRLPQLPFWSICLALHCGYCRTTVHLLGAFVRLGSILDAQCGPPFNFMRQPCLQPSSTVNPNCLLPAAGLWHSLPRCHWRQRCRPFHGGRIHRQAGGQPHAGRQRRRCGAARPGPEHRQQGNQCWRYWF